MAKIVAFGRQGKMVKVEHKDGKMDWFFLSDKVLSFIKNFNIGDEVEFRSEEQKGNKIMTFITKSSGGNISVESPISPKSSFIPKPSPQNTNFGFGGEFQKSKTPEERNDIRRQAVLHATSRVLIGLQGTFDINTFPEISTTIYNHFLKLVNGD